MLVVWTKTKTVKNILKIKQSHVSFLSLSLIKATVLLTEVVFMALIRTLILTCSDSAVIKINQMQYFYFRKNTTKVCLSGQLFGIIFSLEK